MSAASYAAFASIFGLIAFGHALLAWNNWRRGKRGGTFNYLLAATVFFTGAASWCAALG